MSLRTRERESEQRARQKSVHFKGITLGLIAAVAVSVITFAFNQQKTAGNTNAGLDSPQSLTADLLAKMSNDQLESINIEVRNLVCGMDLSNDIGVTQDELLKRLDEMTQRVKVETDRNFHRFHKEPATYENSEAYYRMLMLVTVLQQDYGMLYNPQRVTKAGLIEGESKRCKYIGCNSEKRTTPVGALISLINHIRNLEEKTCCKPITKIFIGSATLSGKTQKKDN